MNSCFTFISQANPLIANHSVEIGLVLVGAVLETSINLYDIPTWVLISRYPRYYESGIRSTAVRSVWAEHSMGIYNSVADYNSLSVGCMSDVPVAFSRWDNFSTLQARGLGFVVGP